MITNEYEFQTKKEAILVYRILRRYAMGGKKFKNMGINRMRLNYNSYSKKWHIEFQGNWKWLSPKNLHLDGRIK